MENILEIADLSVYYHDGTQALRELNLTLPAGQRVGLLGPNGAGKTSLMLAVMNGIHFHGSIRVDGVELTRRSAAEVISRCGMTFQDSNDQLFMPTLLDDVAFGPLNQGLSPQEAQQQARVAIAAVGLAGLETRCAHHLSGGQARCAALATVLSMRVKLLMLDEPTANLDFRSRHRLLEILAGRRESMVLATHDLEVVRALCTHVVVLEAGRLAAYGPMEEILSDRPLLHRHGLA